MSWDVQREKETETDFFPAWHMSTVGPLWLAINQIMLPPLPIRSFRFWFCLSLLQHELCFSCTLIEANWTQRERRKKRQIKEQIWFRRRRRRKRWKRQKSTKVTTAKKLEQVKENRQSLWEEGRQANDKLAVEVSKKRKGKGKGRKKEWETNENKQRGFRATSAGSALYRLLFFSCSRIDGQEEEEGIASAKEQEEESAAQCAFAWTVQSSAGQRKWFMQLKCRHTKHKRIKNKRKKRKNEWKLIK